MAQLDPQNCALQTLHAIVVAFHDWVILFLLAPVAQQTNRPVILRPIGHDHSAFATGAQVFGRVKAEAAKVTNGANPAAFVFGAMRLRCILNDDQMVAPRNFKYRVQIRRLPVKMNRQNGFCALGDDAFDLGHVHRVGARVNVHEYRARARINDGRNSGNEGERDRDDLIASTNARGQERQMQGAGPGIHGNPVSRAAIIRELGLKCRHFAAQRELGSFQDAVDGLPNLLLNGSVLRFQIDQWNHVCFPRISSA